MEGCGAGNEKLLLLHIPKTAGSAIEDAGLAEGVLWGKHMDWDACHLGEGNCHVSWHEPPAFMSKVNPYTNSKVFCVVRNPFDRVVSEYKYIYSNKEYRWDYNELIQTAGCTAEGLNEWVARALAKFDEGGIYVYEQLCHLLPQSYYIFGPPDIAGEQCQYCQEILHQEELPGAFNDLMTRFNYSVRLGEEPVNEGGCHHLTPQDLNTTTRQLVRRIYGDDFKMLNYSKSTFRAR